MKVLKLAFIGLTLSSLMACSPNDKYNKVDLQGPIIEVNESENKILIDDTEKGETWVDISKLEDKESYHAPLEVNVWLSDNSSQVPKAKEVEVVK